MQCTARLQACAASTSLNAMVTPAAREPGPRVTMVPCRTVAKVGSVRTPAAAHCGDGDAAPAPRSRRWSSAAAPSHAPASTLDGTPANTVNDQGQARNSRVSWLRICGPLPEMASSSGISAVWAWQVPGMRPVRAGYGVGANLLARTPTGGTLGRSPVIPSGTSVNDV